MKNTILLPTDLVVNGNFDHKFLGTEVPPIFVLSFPYIAF